MHKPDYTSVSLACSSATANSNRVPQASSLRPGEGPYPNTQTRKEPCNESHVALRTSRRSARAGTGLDLAATACRQRRWDHHHRDASDIRRDSQWTAEPRNDCRLATKGSDHFHHRRQFLCAVYLLP